MVKRHNGKLKHAPPQHHAPMSPSPTTWTYHAHPVEVNPKEREVAFWEMPFWNLARDGGCR